MDSIMAISTIISYIVAAGFSVTFNAANPDDNMQNAAAYYSEVENKIFPCYSIQTVEFGFLSVCQTGDKTTNIAIEAK